MAFNQLPKLQAAAAVGSQFPDGIPGLGWIQLPAAGRSSSDTSVPVHPHLHPVRASRSILDNDSADVISDDSFNGALSDYRITLYNMLNSERWGHQGTVNQLKNERSRRESAERELQILRQQLHALKEDCGILQSTVQSNDSIIRERNIERFNLYQENIRLRSDLFSLQTERERDSQAQALMLDMTPAKDRQIQVLRKRLSRHPFEGEQTAPGTVAPMSLMMEC